MATRIRLQRFGKKNQPFYHVVIADGRAPRDGRFIEKIGTYNPMTHPATIDINFDRALYWVEVGASPSETVRSILKREGVLMMKHLKGGIAKGAITELEAASKFDAWKLDKDSKVSNMKRELVDTSRNEAKKRFEAESKVREAMASKLAARYQAEVDAKAKAEALANPAPEVTEEATPEVEAAVEVEATPEVIAEVEAPEATETPEAAE